MRKIFHAVAHLHTFNIAHRDIKPDNIMFANNSEDAEPKLVDFGMSIMNEKSDLTSKVGTPYYIAPEVINGIYSKECDIWSLGVTLYFMLSLTYPFNGQSMS